MVMEIDEFLNRIGIKDASPTIFRLEEREINTEKKRGIRTHTNVTDGSVSIVGFIAYNKPFPDQIFAIPSEDLKNILRESERIEIMDSKLMGYGNVDFAFNLQVLEKGKGIHLQYDNPEILLDKENIKKILKIDSILSSTSVFIDTDGKNVIITLQNKIGNIGKVTIPSNFPEFHARFEGRFVECLKLAGDTNVSFNLDGYDPKRDHKMHGLARIEVTDSNAMISYYINEITQKVQEKKKVNGSKSEIELTPSSGVAFPDNPEKPEEDPEEDLQEE